MRRLMLLAASILAVASMTIFSAAALATDWDGDGCDEEWEWCGDAWSDDWFSIDDPVLFEEVCSPSLPDDVLLEECLFSDSVDDEGEDSWQDSSWAPWW